MALPFVHHSLASFNGRYIAGQKGHVVLLRPAVNGRVSAAVAGHQLLPTRSVSQSFTRSAAVAEAAPVSADSNISANGSASSSTSDDSSAQLQPQQKTDRPIRVGDKPAAIALVRRLQTTPQTIIRALTDTEQHTYKTIASIAGAQKQLQQPNKVLLYVPFTKSKTFTALVLPASGPALASPTSRSSSSSSKRLTVKAGTDPKALANTLTFDLIKQGSAVLLSAGAAATAKAAAALVLVREQLLSRGYEVGVLPRFEEGQGKEKQITILSQQVVLQELPTPRVKLPRNPKTPLTKAATTAQLLLQKQRRVQLLLQQERLDRLTDMVAEVMQRSAEQQRGSKGAEGSEGKRPPPSAAKKRLLLVWPPSTAEQLLESLEQMNQLPATPPTDTTAAAVESQTAAANTATAAEQQRPSDGDTLVQMEVRTSRLTNLPAPKASETDSAVNEMRKPVVATAESSVNGLAGAIEARVTRSGAAWLWSDGSRQANTAAWAALLAASKKMDAADGAGGLMALVDVHTSAASSSSSSNINGASQQQQQQQGGQQEEGHQQQAAAVAAAASKEGSSLQRLKMLIVRYSDIAKNILQSPNTPMEVSVTTDLWPLLKFTTAANSFLPFSADTGTGGLVLLPAVLPALDAAAAAAAAAVDYRFEDQSARQQLVPYVIRLQRFTGSLAQDVDAVDTQQLRLSNSTDPVKLRDAIVAKVLQQEFASLRFVGPVGRSPQLLSIAVAAVAAARVRLQQKGAAYDVGIMPYAEALLPDDSTQAAAAGPDSSSRSKGRTGRRSGKQVTAAGDGSSATSSAMMVYNLRLVPMPSVAAAAAADEADQGADKDGVVAQ